MTTPQAHKVKISQHHPKGPVPGPPPPEAAAPLTAPVEHDPSISFRKAAWGVVQGIIAVMGNALFQYLLDPATVNNLTVGLDARTTPIVLPALIGGQRWLANWWKHKGQASFMAWVATSAPSVVAKVIYKTRDFFCGLFHKKEKGK